MESGKRKLKSGMIDFHTHSLLSDGELIPSELVARAKARGYRAIGIADHVDGSNADLVVPRLAGVCRALGAANRMEVLAGAEITHVPPALIEELVNRCRELGAEYIIAHGETIAEPVADGTNDAALSAKIDILAHPGLLTIAQAKRAAARGILLEISARKGHCLSNGHVARTALAVGGRLIVGSDAHAPSDLLSDLDAIAVARGAGLNEREVRCVQRNAESLLRKIRNTA